MIIDPYLECSIDLAVDLVNSHDPVDGTEDLATPEDLARFLDDHRVSDFAPPTYGDLERVRDLRGALREVFEAGDESGAAKIINRMLADSGARPELTNHGGQPWHLHFTHPGAPLDKRLSAEAAMALAMIVAREGLGRLGVCEGERCMDVFVDLSRNRSRRYCSPEVCGNRASVAAFRARQRSNRPTH